MRNRAISSARHWRSSKWHAAASVACCSRGVALSIETASSRRAARRTRWADVARRHSRAIAPWADASPSERAPSPTPLTNATRSWAYSPPGPIRTTGPRATSTGHRPRAAPIASPTLRSVENTDCAEVAVPTTPLAPNAAEWVATLRLDPASDVAIRCLAFMPLSRRSIARCWRDALPKVRTTHAATPRGLTRVFRCRFALESKPFAIRQPIRS